MKPVPRLSVLLILLLASLFLASSGSPAASAQSPGAVPKLDLSQFIGTWYVIERYPIKREKHCLGSEMILYALGDKKNSFQIVTSCAVKNDNTTSWNDSGKLDPAGTGKLKLTRFLFLHSNYWVLSAAPDYAWMLVGNPSHKSLWILSRSKTLAPDALASNAAAQGFDTSKLIKIPQH